MWRLVARRAGLGIAALGLGMGEAFAAGYALKEQSATAQGSAFAGATAAAEDVSHMFFNPAALGWVEGIEAQAVASYVAPRSKLEDARAGSVLGVPIGGRDEHDDIAENAILPALYAAAPVGGGFSVGLGVNVPFGLETNYPDHWVGRYHAVKTRLETINLNPALAWRPVEWAALGLGFQAQFADGKLTNAVDFGTLGASIGVPGARPGAQDGFARLEGDDWAYGYTAGILLEPIKGTRLGAAYRSEIEHKISGDVNFRDDPTGIAALLRADSGAFRDSGAELDLKTPASLSLGVHQALTPRLAVMAEAQWTDWSAFEELRIEFDNPAQPDNVTEEQWNDSWFFALGTSFKATEALTLRAGLAYDQSPVKDKFRTPRIPDENRYWLSLGLGWEPAAWLALDAAFTHIFIEDSEVDLAATDRGNLARGELKANYGSDIDILTLSARLRF